MANIGVNNQNRGDEITLDEARETLKDFEAMINDKALSDFEIFCQDEEIPVHKFVLVAQSPVFMEMLVQGLCVLNDANDCDYSKFKDIDLDVMRELLFYMYSGRSPSLEQMADKLLVVADQFEVVGLKRKTVQVLRNGLSVENVCKSLVLGATHDAPDLKNAALNFIFLLAEHVDSIKSTEGWTTMKIEHPELVKEVEKQIAKWYSPEKFIGKWEFVEEILDGQRSHWSYSDDSHKYVKVFGYGYVFCKTRAKSRYIKIDVSGVNWKFDDEYCGLGRFVVGEKFEWERGYKKRGHFQVLFNFENEKLVGKETRVNVQSGKHSQGEWKYSKSVRNKAMKASDVEFHIDSDGMLVVSMECENVKCVRKFRRVKCGDEITSDEARETLKNVELMFGDEKLSDLKIFCRKEEIPVHKFVLVARSPVFAEMLSKSFELKFDDIDQDIMREMLFYMYSGRSPSLNRMADKLLVLADRFQLVGLKGKAVKVLCNGLSVENVCKCLIFGAKYDAPDLKNAALNFIFLHAEHIDSIKSTEGWATMKSEHPELVKEIEKQIAKWYSPEKFVGKWEFVEEILDGGGMDWDEDEEYYSRSRECDLCSSRQGDSHKYVKVFGQGFVFCKTRHHRYSMEKSIEIDVSGVNWKFDDSKYGLHQFVVGEKFEWVRGYKKRGHFQIWFNFENGKLVGKETRTEFHSGTYNQGRDDWDYSISDEVEKASDIKFHIDTDGVLVVSMECEDVKCVRKFRKVE